MLDGRETTASGSLWNCRHEGETLKRPEVHIKKIRTGKRGSGL